MKCKERWPMSWWQLWNLLCFIHGRVLPLSPLCWMLLDDWWYLKLYNTHSWNTHPWLHDPMTQEQPRRHQSNILLIYVKPIERSKMPPPSDTKGKHIVSLLLKGTFKCLQACSYIYTKGMPFFLETRSGTVSVAHHIFTESLPSSQRCYSGSV